MSLYHRAQLQNTVEISVLQNIIIFLLQNLWKFGSHWVTCLSFHAKILPYLPVIMHLLICKNQPSSFSAPFVLDLRADVLSLHLSLRFTGPIPHWRGSLRILSDPASSSVSEQQFQQQESPLPSNLLLTWVMHVEDALCWRRSGVFWRAL